MKTRMLALGLGFFCLSVLHAQPDADTLWKVGFKDQKVNLGMILADGSPLVYSDYTLYYLNPQNGEIKWKSPLNNTNNAKFTYFQGTPYIQVNGLVYNPIDGEQLSLGQNAQTVDKRSIQVKSTYVYPDKNLILIYGKLRKNDKSPDYLIDEAGKRLYYIPKVTDLDELAAIFKNELGRSV